MIQYCDLCKQKTGIEVEAFIELAGEALCKECLYGKPCKPRCKRKELSLDEFFALRDWPQRLNKALGK